MSPVVGLELNDGFSLRREVIASAVLTVIIYSFQLLRGMENYKKHKRDICKGIHLDVPDPKHSKPDVIASNSVHYSGFLVGYMAWGFVICFHAILVLLIIIRLLALQSLHIELVLAVIVPILAIYFLKMLSISSAGKFLFVRKVDKKLSLTSRKTYAVFLYFSFFAGTCAA